MASLNQTTFQPYGFLLNPKPRRHTTPNADFLAYSPDSPGFQTPAYPERTSPITPSIEEVQLAITTSEHGRFLADKLEFILPPTECEFPEVELSSRSKCLFVGQLRFETSANELRFLIQQLTGVTCLKVDARGPGCFVIYVANETDEAVVRALNRRLLFDHNGVWFARTPDATEMLLDFVEKTLPTIKTSRRRALRLPRDCIVIEDSRTRKSQSFRSPPQRPAHYQHFPPPLYGGYSEPTTPSAYSRSGSGFHGNAPPEYVFGECAAPPPPPYSAWF